MSFELTAYLQHFEIEPQWQSEKFEFDINATSNCQI